VSHFYVWRSQTHFRRCRVRRVPFPCLARTDSFSAVPRSSNLVFLFSAPGRVFGDTVGVGSLFSRFALPGSFSAVQRASGPVFMFCAPGLVFGGTEGVRSLFHVWGCRTRFQRYRGCRVPFFTFCGPELFFSDTEGIGSLFHVCAPGLVFGGTEGVQSHFHVLRARTHFRRYRDRRVMFSGFALQESFSAVPSASGPVFMFFALGIVFDGAECVGSRFHVLRSQIRFRWYRGRQVPFSCFALPDSFSVLLRTSGPVFMCSAQGLIFGGAECVGSHFLVLCSRSRFQRYRTRRVPFYMFCAP
jgi:hypothetical protein